MPLLEKRRAELLLAAATLFWGATFPVVKGAVAQMPVMAFLGLRFALAALLLLPLAWTGLHTLGRRGLAKGVFLGALNYLSFLLQTWGLQSTTSSNAAFLTGLNVVWVALLAGPLLGKRPGGGAFLGVVVAAGGLFLLTWQDPWSLHPGDALVVGCSFFVAFHILALDRLAGGHDGRALALVQIATMAALGLGGSLAWEPYTWPRAWNGELVSAFVVTAVFATVFAFWVQTTYQPRTTPTRAALIFTLEPLFGALFSVALAHERLGPVQWAGGLLIVGGMLFSELKPARAEAPPTRGPLEP